MRFIILNLTLFIAITACVPKNSSEEITTIDKGIVNNQWHYLNTTFDLDLALPQGWTMTIGAKPDCKVGVEECLQQYQAQEAFPVKYLSEFGPLGKGVRLLVLTNGSDSTDVDTTKSMVKIDISAIHSEIKDEKKFMEDLKAKMVQSDMSGKVKFTYSKIKLGKDMYTRTQMDMDDKPFANFVIKTKGDFKLIIWVLSYDNEHFKKIISDLIR